VCRFWEAVSQFLVVGGSHICTLGSILSSMYHIQRYVGESGSSGLRLVGPLAFK